MIPVKSESLISMEFKQCLTTYKKTRQSLWRRLRLWRVSTLVIVTKRGLSEITQSLQSDPQLPDTTVAVTPNSHHWFPSNLDH